jgi:hypothetical protein
LLVTLDVASHVRCSAPPEGPDDGQNGG